MSIHKYKAAVIGCGNIAGIWNDDRNTVDVLTHAKAYEKHPAVRLITCCDTDGEKARAFKNRWGLDSCYTSVEEMLSRESVDIISVCVPTFLHAEMLDAILSGPRLPQLILLEKPVASDVGDASAIAKRIDDAGVCCNVNYIRRFDKTFRLVKQTIFNGELGAVQQFRGVYTKGVLNNGSHLINLLHYYFGDITSYQIFDHFYELPQDPTVSLILNFSSGARGVIQGLQEQSYSIFELDIMLEDGAIKIGDFGNRIDFARTTDDPVYPGYKVLNSTYTTHKTDLRNAIYSYLENSIDALEGKTDVLSPIGEGVRDLKLIFEIMKEVRR